MPVTEVSVLAHSMGGLVARSACHEAGRAGLRWRRKLRAMVFLGSVLYILGLAMTDVSYAMVDPRVRLS